MGADPKFLLGFWRRTQNFHASFGGKPKSNGEMGDRPQTHICGYAHVWKGGPSPIELPLLVYWFDIFYLMDWICQYPIQTKERDERSYTVFP